MHNQIRQLIILLPTQIALQNPLRPLRISLLRINARPAHMRHHSIATTMLVLRRAQHMVLWRRLGEPHIASVSAQLSGLEGRGDVLFDDDGAAGGVDEPGAGLHLADELFVEQAAGLLVQWAVDGDDVALGQHLLQTVDAATPNLLLLLLAQGLVIKVQQLLAIKRPQSPQDSLSNSANGNGTNDLVLKIILVLGHGSDVPVPVLDLLVCRDEVADQHEDGHDDVLSDRDDIGAGNFGDSHATVSRVGGIEVNVVGADAGCDGDLEFLGFGEALLGEVAWVESRGKISPE